MCREKLIAAMGVLQTKAASVQSMEEQLNECKKKLEEYEKILKIGAAPFPKVEDGVVPKNGK